MQSTIITQELTHADISKIQALQQKRTLAFVNHFVTTNVQFLNNFMKNCELKLMSFERKLEKVNAAMVLLEARLSSIPELTQTIPQTVKVTETPTTSEQVNAPSTSEQVNAPSTSEQVNAPSTSQQANAPSAEEHKAESEQSEDRTDSRARPEYDRFIKMVQVGVPLQAVKLKVSLEGLDPNVLEEILSK